MKQAESGVRGVFWRGNPRGSQERRLPGGGRVRGDWWIRWTCALGHLHREKIGPKSLAREQYEARKVAARTGVPCPRQRMPAPAPTLGELLDLVAEDYRMNGRRSAVRIRQMRAHLLGHFGERGRAADVTAEAVERYTRTRLAEGAAPATVNRELAALRRAFRLGRRAGLVADVPPISLLTERNVRTGFFEDAEYRAVLGGLTAHVRPVVAFLYLTGWRLGEVLPLRWAQVDLEAGVVRLEPGTTKNAEGRAFPFAGLPELAALLREQRAYTDTVERATGRPVPWVFHHDG
jgi:integrase